MEEKIVKLAICDTQIYFQEMVKEFIEKFFRQRGIPCQIDLFCTGRDFLEQGIGMLNYTAVFLDVNADGIAGMEIARKIRAFRPEIYIIFVTDYNNFALDGYKVDVMRYVLKNGENFEASIYECMDAVLERIKYDDLKRQFWFRECEKLIPLERIIYIESKLHKLLFHVQEDDMQVYTLYEKLNDVEQRLIGWGFVRVHQSYLVNMRHIVHMDSTEVCLSNEVRIPIPRSRYREVKNVYLGYVGEG